MLASGSLANHDQVKHFYVGEARLLWSNKVWKLKWYGAAAMDLWD
jgi:hypothetical protein